MFGVKDKVAAGLVVCEGLFWSRVDHSNDWYEPPENTPRKRPKRVLVLLTHVLCGKVCHKPYLAGMLQPSSAARVSSHNKHNLARLIRLGAEEIDFIQNEQKHREGFELLALDKISSKKQHAPSDDLDDEEYVDNTWEHQDC